MVSHSERALKEYCDVAIYLNKEGQGKFYKMLRKPLLITKRPIVVTFQYYALEIFN